MYILYNVNSVYRRPTYIHICTVLYYRKVYICNLTEEMQNTVLVIIVKLYA